MNIKLDPSDYNPNLYLLEPRRKWFITTEQLCHPKRGGGQLEEDFCLPPSDNSDSITQWY